MRCGTGETEGRNASAIPGRPRPSHPDDIGRMRRTSVGLFGRRRGCPADQSPLHRDAGGGRPALAVSERPLSLRHPPQARPHVAQAGRGGHHRRRHRAAARSADVPSVVGPVDHAGPARARRRAAGAHHWRGILVAGGLLPSGLRRARGLGQRAAHARRPPHRDRAAGRARDPFLLGAGPRRQDRHDPRADHPDVARAGDARHLPWPVRRILRRLARADGHECRRAGGGRIRPLARGRGRPCTGPRGRGTSDLLPGRLRRLPRSPRHAGRGRRRPRSHPHRQPHDARRRDPADGAGALVSWIAHAEAFKPGVRMPAYGHLSKAELEALAAWLEALE